MRMIGDIVKYLDIAYVPRSGFDSVGKAGVLLFRDEVARYADVRDRLRDTMLGMVQAEREGQLVDRASLKKACEMLVALGLGSTSVYEEDFQVFFLAETAQFYAARALVYIDTKDASEWCRTSSSESTLKAIVNMEDSGVERMLANQMNDDLARMFRFLKCVQGGVKTLLDCVSKYLRNLGRSTVNEHLYSGSLIPSLMDLKNRFDYLVQYCFEDDEAAKQVVATDFEYILSLTNKSAEHLAAFVDDVMRKEIRNKTKQEIGQLLDQVMALFRPLQDKDLFERHYKQRLAKRLLLDKSASNETEKAMVAKLRKECGCLFTSKMEAMLKDMHTSSDEMKEFKEAISSCGIDMRGIDVNVRVLTTGFWPLAAVTQLSSIPTTPWSVFQTFRRFYLAKHGGRQLNLQPHLGRADMSAVFYGPTSEPSTSQAASTSSEELRPRTYIIQVSTYQMCVLMLFNHYERIVYEDIVLETNMPETSLVRALRSLCTNTASEPVLTKTPASSEIGNGDVFAVNESFTSGSQKVKLGSTPGSRTSATMNSRAVVNIDEDRRYALEAAIVRVMKARLKMTYCDLFAEVTSLLQGTYTPSAAAFKTRVDALVERVYMERDPDNENVYNYVP
nr:cullin-3-like [Rhipicephalus microplus]